MKNIIIAGSSRAGKSTLSKRLNEEMNYFVVGVDKLVAAFGRAYPNLDIRLNWNREKTTDNIAPFLGHFLGVFSSDHSFEDGQNLRGPAIKGNKFVLEGGYFNFEKILPIIKMYGIEDMEDSFLLIGLVQNNKMVDDFVSDFKKYDTEDDWTYGFNEGELREYVIQDLIPFNRVMTEHLIKYGFTIYDTSVEREQVIGKIVDDIKMKTGG